MSAAADPRIEAVARALSYRGGRQRDRSLAVRVLEVADAIDPLRQPDAPTLRLADLDAARCELLCQLYGAVHGHEPVARPESPQYVWNELLDTVRKSRGQA